MKTLFIYSSLSGNTERLAKGIDELLQSESAVIKIEDYNNEEADKYVLCSWIDKAKPDKKSLDLIDKFKGKDVYLVATLGADPESEHGKVCIQNMRELYKESNVIGVDLVQGSVSQGLIEKFKQLPKDHVHAISEEKLKRYEAIKGRPNQEDIIEAYKKFLKII